MFHFARTYTFQSSVAEYQAPTSTTAISESGDETLPVGTVNVNNPESSINRPLEAPMCIDAAGFMLINPLARFFVYTYLSITVYEGGMLPKVTRLLLL